MRPNETLYVSINKTKQHNKHKKNMAIRVNKDGTVVIGRVLKVTKELETLDLPNFGDSFNRMMLNYDAEFTTALNKRLEACEEAVATAKEINSINKSNIVYTSKEGYVHIYSFNAANAMKELLTKLNEGKLLRIEDMDKLRCVQLLKAVSRFPSPKWSDEEFEMIFSLLEEKIRISSFVNRDQIDSLCILCEGVLRFSLSKRKWK